jgi:hypothetical protein
MGGGLMFGEHIEETIKLFKENGMALDPTEIAMSVIDTAVAQGLIENNDTDVELAYTQIVAEVPYYFTTSEFKKWEKSKAGK